MTEGTANTARRQVGVLAVIGMASRISSQTMTLVLLLLAGRFLTVELFGVFVLASILMNFAMVQMYNGIYHYVLREPAFEQNKGTAFSLQIIFSLTFMAIILLAGGLTYAVGWGELLALLIAATALVPVFGMFGSWQEAVLLRIGDVKFYYGALVASEVTGFVAAVGMLIAGHGVWALIANRYIASILFALALSLRSGKLPRPAWDMKAARAIISYSLGLYGNASLGFFSNYGAAIILGGFLSTTAVGIFRMGSRTAGAAFDIFAQTFRVLTWQAVGRMAREKRLSSELWTRLIAVNLAIMMFVLGSLSLLAHELTLLLLGEQWLPMVPILQILCWVRVLTSMDQISGAQLAAAGHTKFLFRARLLEAGILLSFLLISVQFGVVAVAYALFPSVIVFNAILLRKLMILTAANVGEVARAFAPGIIGAGLALIVVFAVSIALPVTSPVLRISITAIAGAAAFILIAFVPLRAWTLHTLQLISTAILPAEKNEPSSA